MAAGLLWVLDASINISMEPFRAFVADLLPEEQRTRGFAMQSLMIGLGAVLASAMPWILTNLIHLAKDTSGLAIPATVRLSFYMGAAVFFGAVLWTILTTKEYPPEDLAAFEKAKAEKSGIGNNVAEIWTAIREMPLTMRQLAPVQFLTWLGLFCMWIFFGPAIAHSVFGAADAKSPLYTDGIAWGGICFAFYSGVTFVVSFFLPSISKAVGRRHAHSLSLLCGAAGLLSVALIHDKDLLLLAMTGVGIAWASILSMPYSILAASLPAERTGVYMGIFNFFIVTPEIIASLGFGWVMSHWLNNNRLYAVIAGGVFLMIAAALMQRVADPAEERSGAAPKLATANVRSSH
jgi:maltose/moltooligosaccharide transporter